MNGEFFKVFRAYDLSCVKKNRLYQCYSILNFFTCRFYFATQLKPVKRIFKEY